MEDYAKIAREKIMQEIRDGSAQLRPHSPPVVYENHVLIETIKSASEIVKNRSLPSDLIGAAETFLEQHFKDIVQEIRSVDQVRQMLKKS